MKKGLFSPFSLFVYIGVLVALIVYILAPTDTVTTSSTSSSTQNKTLSPEKKPQKEKNLGEIDFDTRLKQINATVGNKVFIRIFKKESLLEVWLKPSHEYVLFKRYPICAYSGYLGPKLKEGDRQSPEGFYKVTKRLLNPKSKYHLAFNLGYPNKYDKAHKRTGSYLMVHGECVSIGCYAMTNEKIEEIYKLVDMALKQGQKYVPVHAYPFYMTSENMQEYQDSKWYNFWVNLKEGYDYFEVEKLPPSIKVENKQYTIYEANQ